MPAPRNDSPDQRCAIDVFYPVLPDLEWLKRLVPLGVRTVQLRLKDAAPPEIERQIAGALELCDRHGATLIVNDYWREAIRFGARYLHLGQEDLVAADREAIRAAGLCLGISTHDRAELASALAVGPDYVALGPIYETRLKVMKWRPQGLERIAAWRDETRCPLVAIGGITLERADAVLAAGASSIAVVTDLVTAAEPEARTRAWLAWADTARTESRT
ncbi:MAG: thiamine phosphate synthase [Rhizobiales bacterium]|nr:thiamine phosphate synthase [Hyphomicrobiales bacterium]